MTPTSPPIHEGGCVCGAVRYRVQGKPALTVVCHCTFCQRRLASAFAMVAFFPHEAVEFVQGEVAAHEHISDASGRWLRMNFCPRCGTTLGHSAEFRPGVRAVAVGTLDEQDWFTVDRHVWAQSKLPWVQIPEGVPTFQQAYLAP